MSNTEDAFAETLARARQALLDARDPGGWWEGELSGSALSTATAVFAIHEFIEYCATLLPEAEREILDAQTEKTCRRLITDGLAWLALHQNRDGGWGDTIVSLSNISTTALCWAAFAADANSATAAYASVTAAAEAWLTARAGGCDPQHLVPAIIARYGKDKTFSVPILTMCALAGRLGTGRAAWRSVPQLPFELAAFPQRWFKWLRLPVVSYALPALIAIGLVRHVKRTGWNLPARAMRKLARNRAMKLLARIQPESGGFLEATPLTSFVVMSLVGAGEAAHSVVKNGIAFLTRSARSDGSWPIDTHLATWVTTLSVNALACGSDLAAVLCLEDRRKIVDWLLAQQYRVEHPYTLADPGGWAWSPLSGGVPDADDTPGALLALRNLVLDRGGDKGHMTDSSTAFSLSRYSGGGQGRGHEGTQTESPLPNPPPEYRERGMKSVSLARNTRLDDHIKQAAAAGIKWLLDLQNRDGGIPTFCRGWGRLPFDRSSADLTAHTLRAIAAWLDELPSELADRARIAAARGVEFLMRAQHADGSWTPLWFGNQHAPDDVNPTYGTARVLLSAPAAGRFGAAWAQHLSSAIDWLLAAQRPGGGWGAGHDTPPSIEETALAVEALADILRAGIPGAQAESIDKTPGDHPLVQLVDYDKIRDAVGRGVTWLIDATDHGRKFDPSPIGFYFAKLWYFEKLYPLIFTVAALESARSAADCTGFCSSHQI